MTYGFRCTACRHEFEITATVSEYGAQGPPVCPRCGAASRRVYTPVMVMSGAQASGSPGPSSSGGCCGGGACGCRH